MEIIIVLLGILAPATFARVILLDNEFLNNDAFDLSDGSSLDPEKIEEWDDRIIFPSDQEWEREMFGNRNLFQIDPRIGFQKPEPIIGTKSKPKSKSKGSGDAEEVEFLKWLETNPNLNPIPTKSREGSSGRASVGDDYCLTCGTRLRCTPPETLSPNGQCVRKVNL